MEPITITTPTPLFVTGVMLIATVLLSTRRGKLGPKPGRYINKVTLYVGVFLALMVFSWWLEISKDPQRGWSLATLLTDAFYSLQMMTLNHDLTPLAMPKQSDALQGLAFHAINAAYVLIHLVAPVPTILIVVELFSQTMARLYVRFWSIFGDTFLITPLDARTLCLAKSIGQHFPKGHSNTARVNIVFTDCKDKDDTALADKARELGAHVLGASAESVLGSLSYRHDVTVVLDDDDTSANTTRAKALQQSKGAIRHASTHKAGKFRIFYVSPPLGTGTTSGPDKSNVTVTRIDWTRNLVESALDRYPLFLLGMEPSALDGEKSREKHAIWQRHMLARASRHVLVVGAGHVGSEFLRLALSSARIDGMRFVFDVFDKGIGSHGKSMISAEERIKAQSPGLLSHESLCENKRMRIEVRFHDYDALSKDYLKFVRAHESTISYVLVALGDDSHTIEVARRTREALNHALVKRCAEKDEGFRAATYTTSRPLILAVIDSDELADILNSSDPNDHMHVEPIGYSSDMYTYEQMIHGVRRDTDYGTLSANASRLHAKYRLFAYARMFRNAEVIPNISHLSIRWGTDFTKLLCQSSSDTREAVQRFNSYLRSTDAIAGGDRSNHEWLVRMEHSRWYTFLLAEGFSRATLEDVDVYLKDQQYHRYDPAKLHPCLVPFDELEKVRDDLNRKYEACGHEPVEEFWKNDDRQLPIECYRRKIAD